MRNAHEFKLRRMAGMHPDKRSTMNEKLTQYSNWRWFCGRCERYHHGKLRDIKHGVCPND